MRLFDLHCDTAYEMYKQNMDYESNVLDIALERARCFEEYKQVMALWCDKELTDEECYEEFFKMRKNLLRYTKVPSDFGAYALSVEDARLLCGKLERLDILRDMGVRFLIPMWSGESIIGGAFDTEKGLTDFGKAAIERCFEIGIIPDISHCSVESAEDIFRIAERCGKPVIASHSCAFSVLSHPRNLRDGQFERIKALGGIVGLSFCAYHLAENREECTTEDIIRHFEHYLSLGGENMTCFGADMDGAPMPCGITGIESVMQIYEMLCKCFGREIADKLTYKNACKFVKDNL